jgi:hypothetical protein
MNRRSKKLESEPRHDYYPQYSKDHMIGFTSPYALPRNPHPSEVDPQRAEWVDEVWRRIKNTWGKRT